MLRGWRLASHQAHYQDRAQHKVDLYFLCCLSRNPGSSTKGVVLINESIGSCRGGQWEHCVSYAINTPGMIHSALEPGTWFSLQIMSFTYPHKRSGKIEQAKTKEHILYAGNSEEHNTMSV